MMDIRKRILSIFIFTIIYLGTTPPAVKAQNFAKTPASPATTQEEAEDDANAEVLLVPKTETTKAQTLQPLESSSNYEGASTYTLGKEDIIDIAVQRHPEFSGQFIINHEGKIQFQYAGDVLVAGLTKEQVRDKLAQLLATYIVSPEVVVSIVQYNSKVVYVYGEVGVPGKIFMRGDTITIREALIQAGLPLLSASHKKSQLITPSADGHPKKVKVNVYALLYEGDLRQNLVMYPGDTIYIPPTGLTKVMRAIQPIAAPIGTGAGTARTVTTGF